jgi:hypothetical protein
MAVKVWIVVALVVTPYSHVGVPTYKAYVVSQPRRSRSAAYKATWCHNPEDHSHDYISEYFYDQYV